MQAGLGDGPDLLGGDVEHLGEGVGEQLGVAEQDGEAAEFVGAAGDGGEPVEPFALDLGLGSFEFGGGGALGGEAGELLVDGGVDLLDGGVAGGLDVEPAEAGGAGEAEQAEAGGDGGAVAADEAVVEPAGLAAAEDGEGEVGGVGLAGAVVREAVGGHQGAGGDVLVDVLAEFAADGVGEGAVARGLLAVVGGDGAEVLLDPGDGLLGVDVADDGEDGVVGRVVGAEERAGVVEGGGVEVGHRADGGVVVGVAVGEGERGELLERGAVGHVVVALAALVLDDVALVLHRRVVEGGEQRAHPVGFQPEGEFELVGRHRLEVVGALEARGAVERAAGSLHEFEVAVVGDVGGALEHQVLEQVGQPGAALDLVAGADVVPEADGGDRGEVVLGEDDPQAVGQAVLGDGDGSASASGGGGCGGRVGHALGSFPSSLSGVRVASPLWCNAWGARMCPRGRGVRQGRKRGAGRDCRREGPQWGR